MRGAWLAVIVALAGCEDSARKPRRRPANVAQIIYAIDLGAVDAADRTEALDQALEVMRARVVALHVRDATVVRRGDDIVVELPDVDEDAFERARADLPHSARLELKLAQADTPFMRDLYRDAKDDPAAKRALIDAEIDGWRTEAGDNLTDYYLRASTQSGIEQYIAGGEIAARDPSKAVPADLELGYELTLIGARPAWRTYVLEHAARLGGADVADASVVLDPNTNQPEVDLVFDDAGRASFGALTEEAHGRKLAILLDGTVISAPVIQTRIDGGRARITMGGTDAAAQQRQAEQLVANLKAGALPVPIMEMSARLIGGT